MTAKTLQGPRETDTFEPMFRASGIDRQVVSRLNPFVDGAFATDTCWRVSQLLTATAHALFDEQELADVRNLRLVLSELRHAHLAAAAALDYEIAVATRKAQEGSV